MSNKPSKSTLRKTSLEVLEGLEEWLENIDNLLPPPYGAPKPEGDDDDDYSENVIEVEEIEVLVDELITAVNLARGRRREAASISELFEIHFGKKSEIMEAASSFEDAINGYLGNLFGEGLQEAKTWLSELMSFVKRAKEECKT